MNANAGVRGKQDRLDPQGLTFVYKNMYKRILRRFLFLLEPERAHRIAVNLLKSPPVLPVARYAFSLETPALRRSVFGVRFQNPVGLAAGFDKNAEFIHPLSALGFGFLEIGTVTPLPQAGNPRPRLFRLSADQALINRMGFNNHGVSAVKKRLTIRPRGIVIGANIGKNKHTPNDRASEDYRICFRELYDRVDYFAINVSSPNTPGLRELQAREPLARLLHTLRREDHKLGGKKPILIKIAPDLSLPELDDIIDIVRETGIQGIIATNTTVYRENLKTPAEQLNRIGPGGLSGKPLAQRATEIIRYIHQRSAGAFPIIGVGGILGPTDAAEKIQAGATLIQIYTGLIYEGPALIKRIKQHLAGLHGGG